MYGYEPCLTCVGSARRDLGMLSEVQTPYAPKRLLGTPEYSPSCERFRAQRRTACFFAERIRRAEVSLGFCMRPGRVWRVINSHCD